ncbi:uncharacterized protein LOC117315207 [Pecten maximus]|uniref:uncharacterized protein LOC117315207 n=1 Tax=Pecten maximus TaxID=6579 RepID=UPI00145819B1|nr:uncharacterized protein LOC117315207 [Pecten maximus]
MVPGMQRVCYWIRTYIDGYMKKRPETLKLFLEDIQWALRQGDEGCQKSDKDLGDNEEKGRESHQDLGDGEAEGRERDQDLEDGEEGRRESHQDLGDGEAEGRERDQDLEDSEEGGRESDQDLGDGEAGGRERDTDLGDVEEGGRESHQDLGDGEAGGRERDTDLGDGEAGGRERDQDLGDEGGRESHQDLGDDEAGGRESDQDLEDGEAGGRESDQDLEDGEEGGRERHQDLRDGEVGGRESHQDLGDDEAGGRESDQDLEDGEEGGRESHQDLEDGEEGGRERDTDLEDVEEGGRESDQDLEDGEEGGRESHQDLEDGEEGGRERDTDLEDVEEGGRESDQDLEDSEEGGRESHQDLEDGEEGGRERDTDLEDVEEGGRESDQDLEDGEEGGRERDTDLEDVEEGGRESDQDLEDGEEGGRERDTDLEDVEEGGRESDQDLEDGEEGGRESHEDLEDGEEGGRERDTDLGDFEEGGRESDQDLEDGEVRGRESHQDLEDSEEGPNRKKAKIVIVSTDEENIGPKRKKAKMISISDEDVVVGSVDSDDSQVSEIFPQLNINLPDKIMSAVVYDSESEEGGKMSSVEYDAEPEDCAIARDVKNQDIYVSLVQKSQTTRKGKRKKNRRVYNAKHPCPFCPKIVANFSHHITTVQQKQEHSVKEILETSDAKTKQIKIALLRLKGAHEHNMRSLKEKKGEIFLRRRSNVDDSDSKGSEDEGENSIDIEKYGPCPKCFGWITLHSIKRHMKMCILSDDSFLSTASKGTLTVQSRLLSGRLPEEASRALIKEVFPIMLEDNVCKVSKEDSLIVSLGNQWMLRNKGNAIMRKYYTSSVMRLAAKLKLALQHLDNSTKDLDEYFQPSNFDVVVKGALRCCFPADADEEELKSPSNAIKLGHDIKRLVSAKLAKALMAGNACKKKEAEEFLKLMEIEWGLRVTKLARIILNERAFNRDRNLPIPDDVRKLAEYMQHEILNLDLKTCSLSNYRKVAVATLARVTLFNRRRCHEVQAMKISSYEKRKTGENELSQELRGDLAAFEKNLLNRQDMVTIRGKTGKGVPVILPQDTKKALQFLTDPENRTKVGVPSGNPYVFGSNGAGVYRAYDAIRTIASGADLQYPNLIRTSNMRKYMATMLQALNTSEAERQWVLDHLGHTMDVHKIHYRMTSDVLERVDVAKILLIRDMGLVGQYRGKKLDDIQLDDLISLDEAPSPDVEEAGPRNTEISNILAETTDSDEYVPEVFQSDEEDDDDDCGAEFSERKRKTRKPSVLRQKWSPEEEKELETLFKTDFERDKCPSQKRVETVIKISKSSNGVIYKRNRDTIKKKVSNMMVKKRRSNP